MAPKLHSAAAASPTEVQLGFDVPVEVTAGAVAVFAATTSPAVPLTAVAWSADGSVVTVTVAPTMTPSALYEVRVAGVVDAAGDSVAPPDDRTAFAGFAPPSPASRRFDLWSMLPRHTRRDDETGDLRRFIACLQEVTDLLQASIDRWPEIFDYERAPEPFVDAILQDLGNPFDFLLEQPAKRRLAGALVQMYRLKGTAIGIQRALRFFLGIESRVVAYNAETLILGVSRLEVDWVLGPSARWGLYAFDLEVNRVLTADERRQVRAVVELMKPAHTHFVSIVEPTTPVPDGRWVLGVDDLGTRVIA
jgi:phage tail-like protein